MPCTLVVFYTLKELWRTDGLMGGTDVNLEFYIFVNVCVLNCLLLKQHRLCMEIIDFSL